MARKQSAADRQKRLDEGACPIHGIGVSQVGTWYQELDWYKRLELGKEYTLCMDGRRDCPVLMKAYGGPSDPMTLSREWEHLLEGESEDELTPRGQPEHHVASYPLPDAPESDGRAHGSQLLIQWSETANAYLATLPEWPEYAKEPVARGRTYMEAAFEAAIALRALRESQQARAEMEAWRARMVERVSRR
jgi:hypothetical protein